MAYRLLLECHKSISINQNFKQKHTVIAGLGPGAPSRGGGSSFFWRSPVSQAPEGARTWSRPPASVPLTAPHGEVTCLAAAPSPELCGHRTT